MNKIIKFLKITLRRFVYVLSGLSIRSNKIWVFGNAFRSFSENARYFYIYCVENHNNSTKYIWVAGSREEYTQCKTLGVDVIYKKSLKGIYYCLRAKVYIFASHVNDISYSLSRGVYKVNLWHGISLKKVEFDINKGPLAPIFDQTNSINKYLHPSNYLRPNLFLSPGNFPTNYTFRSAFRINNDRIVEGMYPKQLDLIHRVVDNIYPGKIVFFYAPTWRDGGYNFFDFAGIDFSKLHTTLINCNAVLIIKLHAITKINLGVLPSTVILADNQVEINALLKRSDCLISDYSSIFFDYLVLDKPILFFPFDKDRYLKDRELYFEYEKYLPGCICNDFDSLIDAMIKIVDTKGDDYKTDRKKIKGLFLSNEDGNEKVYNRIMNDLNIN